MNIAGDACATSVAPNDQSLERLLDDFMRIAKNHEAARQLNAKQLAPDFMAWDFFPSHETVLSKIFGWMLDPRGSHAQGDAFLRSFVSHFLQHHDWAHNLDLEATSVRLEELTNRGRRIDILLKFGGQAALAIENKPTAAWQGMGDPKEAEKLRAQCLDYLDHVRGINDRQYGLIALLGRASDPQAALNAHLDRKETCPDAIGFGFDEVSRWIAKCRALCKAPRVAFFLDELSELLEGKFGTRAEAGEMNEQVRKILESVDRTGAAFQLIFEAEEPLKAAVAADFCNRLVDLLRRQGMAFRDDELATRQNGYLIVDLQHPDLELLIERQGDFHQLSYGLKLRTGGQTRSHIERNFGEIRRQLSASMGSLRPLSSRALEWWIAWADISELLDRHRYGRISEKAAMWTAMADQSDLGMAAQLAGMAVNVRDIVHRLSAPLAQC